MAWNYRLGRAAGRLCRRDIGRNAGSLTILKLDQASSPDTLSQYAIVSAPVGVVWVKVKNTASSPFLTHTVGVNTHASCSLKDILKAPVDTRGDIVDPSVRLGGNN